MSERAKRLFEALRHGKDGVQGLLGRAAKDMGAEIGRLGTQGSMEAASGLYNGHGFVPYGPGQYTPSNEQQLQHNRGMER